MLLFSLVDSANRCCQRALGIVYGTKGAVARKSLETTVLDNIISSDAVFFCADCFSLIHRTRSQIL
jgi:hypothetical protein